MSLQILFLVVRFASIAFDWCLLTTLGVGVLFFIQDCFSTEMACSLFLVTNIKVRDVFTHLFDTEDFVALILAAYP